MILGKHELKTVVFSQCPSCEDFLSGRRQAPHEAWIEICSRCSLHVGFWNFELKFSKLPGPVYSEEEFERFLKLRSFE